MKETAKHAGHQVLIEVDYNILLIFGNPQGILGMQLRPHPIHLNFIIIITLINYSITYY